MTDKKRQEMEMKEAIKAHKRWENITANCFYCYGSEVMPKENIMYHWIRLLRVVLQEIILT